MSRSNSNPTYNAVRNYILIGLGALLFIILFFNSFSIVKTGYTGVRTRMGETYKQNISEGWVWKIPFFDRIDKVNNKQQDVYLDAQIWGETSERAELYYSQITVSYRLEPAGSYYWIASVDNYQQSLFSSTFIGSAIKNMSKQFSNVDASNRALIEPKACECLQQAFNEKYGEGMVTIIKVTIGDVNFQDSYNAAIAARNEAQINYEAQQIENQRQIELAEAQAQVARTTAQGEADAAVIQAQGEADANAIRQESLTPTIINYEIIRRWNGQLPMFSGSGSGFTPVIDVAPYMPTTTTTTTTTATTTDNG